MAVEITISQVNEKMQYLLARSEIMYLPILRTRVNGSIKFLEKFLKFLEGLEDGQGNTSTTNDWKTELREVVYPIEKAVDSFLVRTGLTKASPILYVKSLSGQIVLNNKMKKIVDDLRKMSKQIPEISGKSDGGDHEQGKALEDMGVPSSNNLGDSQLQQSDTSEPYISNGRPESDQEQPKLSEDTWVQPTDLPSNNLGDVGEVTSEQNMSDGRPSQEQTKLPQTDLSSNLRDVKDMGAPGMSEIKEVGDGNHTVGQQISDRSLQSTSSNLGDEIKIAPGKRLQRSGTLSLYDETKNAPGKHLRRSETFYDETKIVVLKDKLQELSQLTLNHYAMYFLISVVGRAGSGKTLLVRQIFNLSQTRQNFDKLAFISVSQNFKEREILAEILQQVAGVKNQEKLSFEVLQQKLRDFLARKRYLIVLDDVHTPDVWNKIKLAFPNSLKGSRVILTIRNANVARRIAPTIVLLHLRPLTDEESWTLFSKRVKMKEDITHLPEFKNVKQQILDKCQGLPLQILVLGGVLASREFNPAEWSKVLNQIKAIGKEEKKRVEETKLRRNQTMTAKRPKQGEIQAVKVTEHVKQKKQKEKETNAAVDEDQSNSPDQSVSEDSLDPSSILALGFQDLSSTLRECFHYLCLFPKRGEIRTRRLFQLWLAEGLAEIPKTGDTNAAEDVVEKYIEDLVQRNMIEVTDFRSDGKPKTCRVQDTLYDKFISDAAVLGYHRIHGNSDSTSKSPKSSIRRFAERLDPQDKRDLNHLYTKDVRSYICFYNQKGDRPAEEVGKFINNTFNKRGFGLLILLDLEGVYKPVLPKTLGKVLPLLKYVGLRWTFLDSIPESVGDLQYLETLDVKHTNITTLPVSIWKAKELQHLYMNEIRFETKILESSFWDYPTKLQTLWGLLIGNNNPPIELLNELKSIRKLGLTCHTESLKELTKWISGLTGLRSLRLRAINEFSEPSDIHLGSMFNHEELTDLYLLGKLPRPIVISELPPNLTNLTLSVSKLSDDPMEMLGKLKELKVLKLLAGSYLGKVMTCLHDGFPNLEVLKLWMLKELEKLIIEPGAMLELKKLEIRYCPKLNKPEGLENLTAETAALKKVTLTNMNEAFITEVEGCLGQKVTIRKKNHVFNPSWVSFFNFTWIKYSWRQGVKCNSVEDRPAIIGCSQMRCSLYLSVPRTHADIIGIAAATLSPIDGAQNSCWGFDPDEEEENDGGVSSKLTGAVEGMGAESTDSVATIALGLLLNDLGQIYEKGGKLDPESELKAFWAPFLLLHLGGPDTITAYSLEDNELFLRHAFQLAVQTGATLLIFFLGWNGSRHSFLSIPMIFVGVIKYGERTWSLWSASSDRLRDTMLTPADPGPNYSKLADEYALKHAEGFYVEVEELKDDQGGIDLPESAAKSTLDANNIRTAHALFGTFKRLFADLILSFQDREKSLSIFQSLSDDIDKAFNVIAIELGFMYDLLYTKASVIYTTWGLISRGITTSLTCLVLVIFSVSDKRKYSKKVDVYVTFLLLVVAIILEIYAALLLLFSDQSKRWLIEHKRTSIVKFINHCSTILVKVPRWSNIMTQYSITCFCLKEKPGHKILRLFHLDKLREKHRYKTSEKVPDILKKSIFKHVGEKYRQFKEKQGTNTIIRDLYAQPVGSVVLKEWSNKISKIEFDHQEWSNKIEFDQSILIWHIATDLCYFSSSDQELKDDNCKTSKLLSDYMLYLLVMYPFLLPVGIGLIRFRDTQSEASSFFKERRSIFSITQSHNNQASQDQGTGTNQSHNDQAPDQDQKRKNRTEAITMLLRVKTHVPPIKVKGDRSKSVLFDACRLASALNKISDKKKKWEMIRDVWLEMLTYAACQSRGSQHARHLRRGGELLTHVWLLMSHFGLTEQFQISQGHARAKLTVK
ncbi:hypothetical protein Q3G72_024065 [Acer saccharum]|nr:hypothetical protein Q3G72_024065 [Acer saccharum]